MGKMGRVEEELVRNGLLYKRLCEVLEMICQFQTGFVSF
jgi:hypothetical protein